LAKDFKLMNPTANPMVRPQLTLANLMLLIAVSATCIALYAASARFAPVSRSASASAELTALLVWSLAAGLPALWVGTVRRNPPSTVLVRFAVGNGFLAMLLVSMSALLVVILLGAAAVVPSLGWYRISQMSDDEDRDRLGASVKRFMSYVVQLVMTSLLFVLTIPLLAGLLR
jgi:hypothetical protein